MLEVTEFHRRVVFRKENMASVDVYAELPAAVEEDAKTLLKPKNEEESGGKKGKNIDGFLRKHLPDNKQRDSTIDNLRHRVFFIDNTDRPKKRFDLKRKRRHKLTSKEKRQLGLFKIPRDQQYVSFLPLHTLWQEYVRDLIDFSRITEQNKQTTIQQKLLKADYHGAILTVTKAKNPSMIGHTGIMVQETKNVFKIVSKDNKVKMIPKENTVFTVEVEGFRLDIDGSHFRFTAAERVHRKFKFTPRKPDDL